MGLPPMTAERDGSGCIAFMNAAFGLRFEAAFFFAGAFLLAFFFAAIRCLPFMVVVGWILVPLPLLPQHGDERMPRENAVVNRSGEREQTQRISSDEARDAWSVFRRNDDANTTAKSKLARAAPRRKSDTKSTL